MEAAPLSHVGLLPGTTEAPDVGEGKDSLAEVLPLWGPVLALLPVTAFPLQILLG